MPGLRPAFKWVGGKAKYVDRILPNLPPHHTYVEPFGGSAAVLLAKEPAPVEVYNDLDSGCVQFFRVLRNPEQAAELHRRLELTPFSREEYRACLETWAEQSDSVERALRWYVVARQSFGGEFGNSWGYTVTKSRSGMAEAARSYNLAMDRIPELVARMRQVQIEHDDGVAVIRRYDTPETLHYCDPPYAADTRRGGGYDHEMDDEAHRNLVETLLAVRGMVLLSGYDTSLYVPLVDAGWTVERWDVDCHLAGRTRGTGLLGEGAIAEAGQRRTECLWINPAAQEALRRPKTAQALLFG